MAIKKNKNKRRRKERKPRRKRRGVSLTSSPVESSSSAVSSSSGDSPSSMSSATPSTSLASTTIGSAPETNTNKTSPNSSSNSDDASPKRRKKRKPKKRKRRPRKRKGTSLAEAEILSASATESNPAESKIAEGISPTNNPTSESNSTEANENESSISLTAGQLKRRELQEKKEELRQKKIEKLKEKNPKLYKKIKDVLAEQEAKIKEFADNLPEEKKAAFLAYSKSLSINSWNQKFEFENANNPDQSSDDNPIDKLTGLNKENYNYDKKLLQKLGHEKVEQLQTILQKRKRKIEEFKKTLNEEELGDFDDADISPRFIKLTNFLESGFEGKDAKDLSALSTPELQYESSKINFKLLRFKNQGTLSSDKIKAKAALENKLKHLQIKMSANKENLRTK